MKTSKQLYILALLLVCAGHNFLMAQNNSSDNGLTFKPPTYVASALFNWPHQYSFVNGKSAYMGLQTSASFKGENTKIAIFSIWDSKGAESAANGFSEAYGHEGNGYSCRIKYNWQEGRKYRVRVWELEKAVAPETGTWWGSWVMNMETQEEEFIGKILVPESWQRLASVSYNFTEYWGSQDGNRHPCSTVGYTYTVYDYPTMSNGAVKPTNAIFERNDECASLSKTGQIGPNTYQVEGW